MGICKRIISLFATVIILITVLTACEETQSYAADYEPDYKSYKDIDGVTQQEIDAVEELKKQYKSFVYGSLPSTEAFYGEDGKIKGFADLFCKWMEKLFDIPFEIKFYEWDELLEGLESHEIDFTGEMTKTDERIAKGYFMTDAIAERSVKIMRLANSPPLIDISAQRPLRYAFLNDTTTYEDVKRLSNDVFEATMIGDYATAYKLLESGEIDGFIDEGPAEAAFDEYKDIVSKNFFPLIYSPVSLTTHNEKLAPVISVMQKTLTSDGMHHLTDLYNKGHHEYIKHKFIVQLTKNEAEYIKNNKTIPFLAESDNYPMSFYDTHTDDWNGIAFDVLKEITTLTGIEFNVANDRHMKWDPLFDCLKSGEVKMITELIRTRKRELDGFIWPETSIIIDKYALISRSETKNLNINEILFSKVGLQSGTAHTELFESWFPNHANTKPYDSFEEAIEGIERGEVDLLMASQLQLLDITNYKEYPGYKANVVFEREYNSTFGFHKDAEVLCSIVDKALRLVDIKSIAGQWTRKTYDYRAKMASAQRPYLIGSVALMLCVLSLAIVLLIRRSREGRRLERLVHQRTTKLEAVLSNYKGIVWSVDKNGMITSFSGQYLKKIGIESSFLEGKNIEAARNRNRHLDVIDNIDKTIKEGPQEWVGEIDGGIFQTYTTPLYDEKGMTVGVVGSTDDITETFKLQKDLETAVHTAEAANRAKSEFLANMSHEMRTPMNAIIGMTAIGNAAEQTDKKDYCFNKIEDASKHLLGVINDILDMSKIEAGKFELSEAEFNFEKLIKRVVNVSQFITNEKHQKIILKNDEAIPKYLKCDDQRLAQVVSNLFGNAVKFTPENGTITIESRLLTNDAPGSKRDTPVSSREQEVCMVQIMIKDTGIGISKEQQERLFKSFEQAKSDTTRKYGGTGLGLAISKSIIEMMGGEIWVCSEPSKGSSFFFTFKAKKAEKDTETKSGYKEQAETDGINYIWGDYYILLAEDVDINREIVTTLLESTGIKIDCAENGKQAVDLFLQNPDRYDMIFMDLQMPEMDGYEATQQIRNSDKARAKKIPIVAMTANVFREDVERCLAAGMNGHIGKPINFDEVLYVLKMNLK